MTASSKTRGVGAARAIAASGVLWSLVALSAWAGHVDTSIPLVVGGPAVGGSGDGASGLIDLNSIASPFAGVGSITFTSGTGAPAMLGTAVAISPRHIVSAGHTFDADNDGTPDTDVKGLRFNLNFGGDLTHVLEIEGITVHPGYTGFKTIGNTYDDLSVLTLRESLPATVPA